MPGKGKGGLGFYIIGAQAYVYDTRDKGACKSSAQEQIMFHGNEHF